MPREQHRATVTLSLASDGNWSLPHLVESGGDRDFDRTVLAAVTTAVTRPSRWRLGEDSVPRRIPTSAVLSAVDSIGVILLFGERPQPGDDAIARFAVQERPAYAGRRNAAPMFPGNQRARGVWGEVLMQFLIDSSGVAVPHSLAVLRATNEDFVKAVLLALPRHRFHPALVDCRPVPEYARQLFVFDYER